MPQGHKVRLPDGSVIHLDRNALLSWRQRRLIGDQDLVQPPGSTRWVPLAEVLGSAQPAPHRPATAVRSIKHRPPRDWGRWLRMGAATVAAVAVVGGVWWTYPRWRPLLSNPRSEPPAAENQPAAALDPFSRAVMAVVQESPHLTPRAIEELLKRSAAGVLDPPEAFRRAYFQAGRGLPSLTAGEAREFRDLNANLYTALAAGDRARLGTYLDRVRAQRPTRPQEDAQMCRLVRTAVLRLPERQRERLRVLFEKAIVAGLEKTTIR